MFTFGDFDPKNYQPERRLTSQEASICAKVNRRTICQWIQDGALKATRAHERGHYQIKWEDLDRALSRDARDPE